MPAFRNIENNGVWAPGGEYTFEAYCPLSAIFPTSCYMINPYNGTCQAIGDTLATGAGVVGSTDKLGADGCGQQDWGGSINPSGNLLFNTKSEDGLNSEDVSMMIGSAVDMGDDWYKFTVGIPADFDLGRYYLKHKTFSECMMLV